MNKQYLSSFDTAHHIKDNRQMRLECNLTADSWSGSSNFFQDRNALLLSVINDGSKRQEAGEITYSAISDGKTLVVVFLDYRRKGAFGQPMSTILLENVDKNRRMRRDQFFLFSS